MEKDNAIILVLLILIVVASCLCIIITGVNFSFNKSPETNATHLSNMSSNNTTHINNSSTDTAQRDTGIYSPDSSGKSDNSYTGKTYQ